MISASLPLLVCGARTSYTPCLSLKCHLKNSPHKANISAVVHLPLLLRKDFIQFSFCSRYGGISMAALSAKDSGSGEEDNGALEAVLKLYTAIKHRNISELSDIIEEECQCLSNFISTFQPFYGKKQVLDFFSTLMKNMGTSIQFVVQPTLHDGMNVGVSWSLECNKTHVPLGKGFSLYMCHAYQGKVMIRNVEMFMEPLLHIEPLRLKMMGSWMTVMDKIGSNAVFKGNMKRSIYLLLALLLMIALLLFPRLFCKKP
ncbi:uncharacterized protein LOC127808702 [Diospyros lotus]|uniref:uncharacterized protein LOC127808701 n=1 Tax=Diospyros lotus TaxID=55363 RepID=UPI0022524994|nr:uncharacterized protein LOC127808701 [Diospyros lotus]XP_052203239.1 uncharacterized protein LOC127808702 [Diospyros lotus]